MKISLTREIQNEDGYIDWIVDQIGMVPKDETLEMVVTCEGGNTFQGARLHRAIMEHEGNTKFTGIGLAASMAGVLMSAFDEVELDEEMDIMLHKAHIPGVAEADLEPEQLDILNKFNNRAYKKLLAKGVDQDFLDNVFLSDDTKDYWITAKEAEELGFGKVIRIERRDSTPFKVAAKLKTKIENRKMGIFKNNSKAVTRTATLKDGRVAVFKSEKETVAKGDILEIVGSAELLVDKIELANGVVLNMGEGNEVAEVEEAPAPDASAELNAKIEALEAAIAEMKASKDMEEEEEDDEEMEAKAKKDEEEAKAKDEEIKDLAAKVDTLVNAFTSLKSDFKLKDVDNKSEKTQETLNHLTDKERQAYALKQIANGTKIQTK